MKFFKCNYIRNTKKIKPRIIETHYTHDTRVHERLDEIHEMLHHIIDTQERFEKTCIKRNVEADTEHILRCEILELNRIERESTYKKENDTTSQDIKIALIDLANKTTQKRGFFQF